MEITIFPAGFGVVPAKVPQKEGPPLDAMQVRILDAGGTAVSMVFGQQDWESFQRFVADPQGEAERVAARAKIAVVPAVMAPRVGERKH